VKVDWNLWKDEDDEDEGGDAAGNPFGGMDMSQVCVWKLVDR